jgi:DNA-binding MarR family transcriptional regulator
MDGSIFNVVGCGCDHTDNYRLLSVPFSPAILVMDGSAGRRNFGWVRILYSDTLEITVAKLNNIIHQPIRLQIMSSLIALDTSEEVEFTYLRKILDVTDGNLGAHLTKLENVGYIKIKKTFVARKPRTFLNATDKGRDAFDEHTSALRQIIKGSKK